MLDARQVDWVVQQLKREEAERKQVDPALPARLAQDRMLVEQRFARLGDAPFSFELAGSRGLVEAGMAALVALLTRGSRSMTADRQFGSYSVNLVSA